MKMTERNRVLRKMGIDWSARRRAAAAWPARSASRREVRRFAWRSASWSFCRRCALAPPDSLIIADGFSCREQIAQSTDRHALHLAEVIATALKGPLQPDGAYPEQPQVDQRQAELDRSMKRAGLAVAGIAAAAALLWWLKGRK